MPRRRAFPRSGDAPRELPDQQIQRVHKCPGILASIKERTLLCKNTAPSLYHGPNPRGNAFAGIGPPPRFDESVLLELALVVVAVLFGVGFGRQPGR